MTTAAQSPVARVIRGVDGEEYVVRLTSAGILIRRKGQRESTAPGPLPVHVAYVSACKLEAKLPPPAPARVRRGGHVSRGLLGVER